MTKEDVIKYVQENGHQELVVATVKAMHAEGTPLTVEEMDRRVKLALEQTQQPIQQPVQQVQQPVQQPAQFGAVINDPAPPEEPATNMVPMVLCIVGLVIGTALMTIGMNQTSQTGMPSVFTYVGLAFSIIIPLVAQWKIFVKAGKPGWASIIPLYNIWVFYDIIWARGTAALRLLIPFYNIYWAIRSIIELCQRFGKDTGFKVGMVFLPNIFQIILAFDDSRYI